MDAPTARWPTTESRSDAPELQTLGNFVTVFGLLALFNGVCVFLLGLLTELGVTNETTAKWSELNDLTERFLGLQVTAESSDIFGLQVLAVGVVVFAVGKILQRVSGEK